MDILSLDTLPSACLVRGKISQDRADFIIKTLISKFNVSLVDFLSVASLTVEAVQLVHSFADFQPMGTLKLVTLFMNKATVRAQNSLLTLLENPPERIKFVLFSDSGILETVESRCEIFNLKSDLEYSKQSKAAVLAVLKAASELNDILLEDLFKNWDEEASNLLIDWAAESLIRKPDKFSQEELSFAFPRGFQENLILALSASGSARGRLNAKSIMLTFVGRSKGVR